MSRRLVPWSSWGEWAAVGGALLAGCADGCGAAAADAACAAASRVATWRVRGRLPLAVEVTAALAEARAQDAAFTGRPGLSEAALRALYALAVVRLVNGVTDPAQKGRFAAPVASLARAAGLPALLVDIRHETAHNALPSLALLRVAAGAAAEWCASRYWEPQSALLATKRGATAAALRELAATHVPAAPGPRRSSAAAAPRDSDDDEDDEETEAAAPADAPQAGPSASALRRRRGAALRALAELVPPAGAPLLVAPLLDDGLLAPPAQLEPPPPLPPQPQLPPPPPVDDAAWEATVRTLARRWPPLTWLLLAGAARRLSAGGGGVDDAPMPDAARAAALGAWVSRLAALSAAPPGGAPPLSAAQRRGVMRALLAAPAASPGAAAAAAAAAALAQPRGAAPAQAAAAPAGGADALAAAEAEVRALKRRRADADAGAAPAGAPARAWTRVEDWTPCAVGAPPPWVLTLDGAPELEPSPSAPPLALRSALFPDAGAPRDAPPPVPPLRIGAWAGDGPEDGGGEDARSESSDGAPSGEDDDDAGDAQGAAAWALPGVAFDAPRAPAFAAQLL